MNLNKVFLLGRLTADPQLRTTASGQQVATFSIATNRVWNDRVTGKKEEVQFHNIVVWARQAEIAARFLQKGGLVFIEGRIQTRGWVDAQGGKRKTTEIVAENIQLGPRPLGAKPAGEFGAKIVESSNPESSILNSSNPEVIPSIDLDAPELPTPDAPPPDTTSDHGIRAEDLNF